MSWLRGFVDRIVPDVPLGSMTWFRLGGRARYLFRPTDAADLAAFLPLAKQEGLPVKVLGAGANVLVRDDGFDGVVIRLDKPAFRRIAVRDGMPEVGAGVDLMPLVRRFSREGLSGMECLAGIPATLGGAVRMNAGGRFGEISQVIRDVRVMDDDGSIETWSRDRLGFGYRRSAIDDRIVLCVRLDVHSDDPAKTLARYAEHFAYKEKTQPMEASSAGCIFKNPQGESAGALIDRAGLKGLACGGAQVSFRHANFFVTDRDALACDVLGLIDTVRRRVLSAFGTTLELEVDVW